MHSQHDGRRRAGVVAVALAIGALGLAACGDDEESSSSGGSSGGGDGRSLTLIAGVKGDEFYITMNCGAQAEAKKLGVLARLPGSRPVLRGAPDAGRQRRRGEAARRVLIAPTDTKAMYAPIKQLADGGSKVVLVDTTLEQPDVAVSQIASDNVGGGKEAAKALKELMGGTGSVFVVNVKPGISTTDQRGQGFEEEAKALGLDYLGQDFSNDQPEKAAAIVKAQLAKNPDLKGIFATNLFSAEGAASGLREAGKLGQVKIVGFDAGPKQVQDLEDGTVQALIAQEPAEIGKLGVQQAVAAIKGETTKPEIGTGFTTITKDNLAENQDALYKSSC